MGLTTEMVCNAEAWCVMGMAEVISVVETMWVMVKVWVTVEVTGRPFVELTGAESPSGATRSAFLLLEKPIRSPAVAVPFQMLSSLAMESIMMPRQT